MSDAGQRIRVSIVVPVYNPGPHIESLIESLAKQTMPQGEFEVIYSDDGSTDDTPLLLDRLAADSANVTVLHEPNSGWPGRPRNLGMDVARGDYVFFVDQDDWLGIEALERMCAFAEQNRSDVVIGRYAGHNRGVAKAPFVRTRPDATLENTPLMDSLTPHKMFRTEFLREQGLRFPEGRRRLEDHVFVVQAYFLAQRISVLADYHCYFHVSREDAGNAGYQRIDPAGYYGNVREVVDIVLAHTEPGKVRDRCLRRSLRTELLGRIDGRAFLKQDPAYQHALFDEARQLAEATMPLSVDAGLSPPQRVRAALLRANRFDDTIATVEHYVNVQPDARLLDLKWDDTGGLVIDLEGGLIDGRTRQPWRYDVDGDVTRLSAPPALGAPFPEDAAECTAQLPRASAQIVFRRREDSEEWPAPTHSSVVVHRDGDEAWTSVRATARVDVQTLGGGALLTAGIWDVFARVSQTGWTKDKRLGAARLEAATQHRRPASLSGHLVLPYWTKPHDNLSVEIEAGLAKVLRDPAAASIAVQVRQPVAGPNIVEVQLPLAVAEGDEPAATLRLANGARIVDIAARTARSSAGELSLAADLPVLEDGAWEVSVALDDADRPVPIGRTLAVSGETIAVSAAPTPARQSSAAKPRAPKPPLIRRIRRKLGAVRRG